MQIAAPSAASLMTTKFAAPNVRWDGRLAFALTASVLMHSALFVGMRPATGVPGAPSPEPSTLRARLVQVPTTLEDTAMNSKPAMPEAPARPEMPSSSPHTRAIARTESTPSASAPSSMAGETPAQGEDQMTRSQAAGAYYFTATELDERAQPIGEIDPPYPPEAGGSEGYLILQVLINEFGKVDRVNVMVSDPEGVFDDVATATFGAARFRPAYLRGRAVKSEMLVELKFDPGTQRLMLPDGTVVNVMPGTITP